MPAQPGTYRYFSELSAIDEDDDRPGALDMVRRLVSGHETAVRTARTARDVDAVTREAIQFCSLGPAST